MVEMALKGSGKEKVTESFQSRIAGYSYRKKKKDFRIDSINVKQIKYLNIKESVACRL